jgi:hypothetical protein
MTQDKKATIVYATLYAEAVSRSSCSLQKPRWLGGGKSRRVNVTLQRQGHNETYLA